ncbi:hypothetical protein HUS23_08505 [Ectothiorhodospiraceae bacterium 2226]|nr:hypothetical protein HUS23_08505 [Ectothiorhodospiraceae bacterium 2226]
MTSLRYCRDGAPPAYQAPAILSLLRQSYLSRTLAALVIVAFTMLITQPVAAAFQGAAQTPPAPQPVPPSKADQLSRALQKARDVSAVAVDRAARGQAIAEERRELATLRRQLVDLRAEAMADFASVGAMLQAREVPEVIHQRQRDAVAAFNAEMDGLLEELAEVEAADTDEGVRRGLERAKQRLTERQLERSQHPFNPNELPHGPQLPNPDNRPKLEEHEFRAAGLYSNPLVQLAALENYRFDTLPGAADPAYLGETVEVPLTPAIRAKAEELGYEPVNIYHWVRNHVEWVPSWGAVQDADLTLSAQRGNAMDTASLLIALLRASGVPARYVHGTIEVPEARFRNWAGGFESIEAAMNYASSGGIPTTGITQGGRVVTVRMEHVWAEAAVDFLPSRAAIMREADTWLALDASYKQYEYLEGLDVAAIANLDGEALAASFMASGAVDEAAGWVQGLDASIIEAAQQDARQALEAHIEQMTDPTVGDVIGGRKVVIREAPVLPSAMPFARIVEGARYAALPAALQPTITFGLGADILGTPLAQAQFPWAQLNNRKVTLSFRPATQADEDALHALLPEGEITDISQLPSSIPAYLIKVVPELKVEGETELAGAAMKLGEELAFRYSVRDPVHGMRHYPNKVLAGSYIAVGVIGGNVAPSSLRDAQSELESTRTKLGSGEDGQLEGLTREDLLGEMFHAGLLGYFAQYNAVGRLIAQSRGGHFQLVNSAGSYGYVPTVTYFFGVPRAVIPGGVEMDLDRVAHVSNVDQQPPSMWAAFNFHVGAVASALEHVLPEQMFKRNGGTGGAVSAVKALQLAAAQGQRIYHITKANQGIMLPDVRQSQVVMNDISAALAVGKEVVVHASPISVPGWVGAGYVIVDPSTGAGAWKIGGGANGGFLSEDAAGILGFMGFALGMIGAGFGAPILVFLAAAIAMIIAVNLILEYLTVDHNCSGLDYLIGLAVLAAFAGIFASGIGAIIVMYVGLIAGGAALATAKSSVCAN